METKHQLSVKMLARRVGKATCLGPMWQAIQVPSVDASDSLKVTAQTHTA